MLGSKLNTSLVLKLNKLLFAASCSVCNVKVKVVRQVTNGVLKTSYLSLFDVRREQLREKEMVPTRQM